MRLGRPLTWDPEAEKCVNDPEADTYLNGSSAKIAVA